MFENETFYRSGRGFISVCKQYVDCPPYVIASVAKNRVAEGAEIDLPEGYNGAVFDNYIQHTGRYDAEVSVNERQARELRQIGGQILSLNESGQIQPPLTRNEEQLIHHLLNVVPANQSE